MGLFSRARQADDDSAVLTPRPSCSTRLGFIPSPLRGRFRLLGIGAGASVLAGSVVLLVGVGPDAVLLLLVALVVVGTLGLAKLQVDARVRLRRHDERVTAVRTEVRHTNKAVETLGDRVDTLHERIESFRGRLSGISEQTAHIRHHLGNADRPAADYRQLEATLGLYQLLDVRQRVPPMRGWAASPDFLLEVVSQVLSRRPGLVLECGSGVSTLLIAYALQRNGAGLVHSLDHEDLFAQKTRELLDLHELAEWARVVHAPLEPVTLQEDTWWWYTPDALEPLGEIDMAVVDGPPHRTQSLARYPLLPLVHDKLGSDAVLLLDDYKRDDEREIVKRWLMEFGRFECEEHDHEKGTAVLAR